MFARLFHRNRTDAAVIARMERFQRADSRPNLDLTPHLLSAEEARVYYELPPFTDEACERMKGEIDRRIRVDCNPA